MAHKTATTHESAEQTHEAEARSMSGSGSGSNCSHLAAFPNTAAAPCGPHGHCNESAAVPTCVCEPGWTGRGAFRSSVGTAVVTECDIFVPALRWGAIAVLVCTLPMCVVWLVSVRRMRDVHVRASAPSHGKDMRNGWRAWNTAQLRVLVAAAVILASVCPRLILGFVDPEANVMCQSAIATVLWVTTLCAFFIIGADTALHVVEVHTKLQALQRASDSVSMLRRVTIANCFVACCAALEQLQCPLYASEDERLLVGIYIPSPVMALCFVSAAITMYLIIAPLVRQLDSAIAALESPSANGVVGAAHDGLARLRRARSDLRSLLFLVSLSAVAFTSVNMLSACWPYLARKWSYILLLGDLAIVSVSGFILVLMHPPLSGGSEPGAAAGPGTDRATACA